MMISAATENELGTQTLPQISQVFLTEWARLQSQANVNPHVHLRPDLLTVEMQNALSVRERGLAQTEAGHDLVLRSLNHWIDHVYPRLAGQIESLLDCYVTSTGVEVEPGNGSVRVQIGLRRAPVLML
jgi:Na+-translocating membrane potential-generating system (MpsC)